MSSDQQSRDPRAWTCATPCANSLSGAICSTQQQCQNYRTTGECEPEPTQQSRPLAHLIAEATVLAGGDHPCSILGHKWVMRGGASCCCPDGGGCSIPVHECVACGECDYGDTEEAVKIRARCVEKHADARAMEMADAR